MDRLINQEPKSILFDCIYRPNFKVLFLDHTVLHLLDLPETVTVTTCKIANETSLQTTTPATETCMNFPEVFSKVTLVSTSTLGRYFSTRHGTASARSRERRKSDVLRAADRKAEEEKLVSKQLEDLNDGYIHLVIKLDFMY